MRESVRGVGGTAVDGGSMAIILFYTHTAQWVVLPMTGRCALCGDARRPRVAGLGGGVPPLGACEPVRWAHRCPTHATTNDRRLHTASLAAMDSYPSRRTAGLSGSWRSLGRARPSNTCRSPDSPSPPSPSSSAPPSHDTKPCGERLYLPVPVPARTAPSPQQPTTRCVTRAAAAACCPTD